MGVVYRGRRRADGVLLAIKMILRGRDASFAELARFRIEAEALACLDHPNIINIRDVGVFAGYPFFAMDFADGGSLKQAIAGGPMEPGRAAGLVRTVALAMEHAHSRGILHRDLKPANVLMTGDGTPKVSDFGLVKFVTPVRRISEAWATFSCDPLDSMLGMMGEELASQYDPIEAGETIDADEIVRRTWEQCATRTGVFGEKKTLQTVRDFLDEIQQTRGDLPNLDGLTLAGSLIGSPSHMAPEQALGDLKSIGPRTDVYSLGIILYELLTGRPPFQETSLPRLLTQIISIPPSPPGQFAPGLPGELGAICLKCLDKSPDGRYQDAAKLAEALARFLDGRPTGTSASPWSIPSEDRPSLGTESAPETRPPDESTAPIRPSATRSWWPFRWGHPGSTGNR